MKKGMVETKRRRLEKLESGLGVEWIARNDIKDKDVDAKGRRVIAKPEFSSSHTYDTTELRSLPRESYADDATLVDTSYLSQEERIKPETE